jgi:hypothetical protein
MARLGLWALPVWAMLLFYSTLSHQPPPQAQFAAWSRFVTTPEFLASHLIGSIVGAAIGILGMVALAVFLVGHRRPQAAVWGLVTGVLGTTLVTAIFGIAAFAQPASAATTWSATLPRRTRCTTPPRREPGWSPPPSPAPR